MADLRTTPRPADAPALPPYRRSRGPFIALLVLLAVGVATVVFLLVTAGDDDVPSQSVGTPATPTTPPPPTTLDPDAATRAEIEDAYRQSRDAFVAVASDPNARLDDPRLAKHKKGTALAAAQLSIRKLRSDGHVLQVIRLESNPRVVELGPDTAVVEDCGIDVSAIVDHETGEVVVPAGPPEPQLNRATYELFQGVWMQNSFKAAQGPCAPPGS
jgi:hypothetical protein